ncbi:MAG TPA: thiamine phosphate synthase [Terriglobales bacterium]|jgi:thiamine-phosphate pyrophosphorylase|nr:thiamine phosphate synthase [Terriglobales bacterium]
MIISLPRFYPILDAGCFATSEALLRAAEQMVAAGARILQYRNKSGDAARMLIDARELRQRVLYSESGDSVTLIMNDRADLCLAADFEGLHVGQDDLSPASARKIVGPNRWLGVSTHNNAQVIEADETSADYIAIGPVFGTASKVNPDPVVGLEGVREARELTSKPLVAIGGIARTNCAEVIEAGADSVAVISDLTLDPRKSAEEFLRILG